MARSQRQKSKAEQARDVWRQWGYDYYAAWIEYDAAAEWCAKRNLKGVDGDPLPENLSGRTVKLIADDPEAFQERVRATAYAIAMDKLNLPEE